MSEASDIEGDVLRANAAFYRSFSTGDHAAMSELWAGRIPITCLHPGSPVLVGREAVLASWRDILRRSPPPFELRCDRPVVSLVAAGVAIVSCYEAAGEHPAQLAATNVFALEGGRWRMVHHQAGHLSTPIPRTAGRSALN